MKKSLIIKRIMDVISNSLIVMAGVLSAITLFLDDYKKAVMVYCLCLLIVKMEKWSE